MDEKVNVEETETVNEEVVEETETVNEEVVEELEDEVTEKVEEESIMSLDALKAAYVTKNAEMKEKYKDLIYAIAAKEDKDIGVAFEMLKAVYRGGEDYLKDIDVEFDRDELMRDCKESMELSVRIADAV